MSTDATVSENIDHLDFDATPCTNCARDVATTEVSFAHCDHHPRHCDGCRRSYQRLLDAGGVVCCAYCSPTVPPGVTVWRPLR